MSQFSLTPLRKISLLTILVTFLTGAGCVKPTGDSVVIANSAPAVVSSETGATQWANVAEGRILDESGQPASGVSVVINRTEFVTGADGSFRMEVRDLTQDILIRKPGYQKIVLKPQGQAIELKLKPLVIRAVYLQANQVRSGSPAMQNVVKLIQTTELNAIVVDIKDDDGRVQKDAALQSQISKLKSMGVYLIARIVAFKDNTITRTNPELAIKRVGGTPWEDKHGVRYLNPFNPAAHQYLISVAKMAVELGFDEIQYDYVRFPTDGNLSLIQWDQPVDWKVRSQAIAALLKQSRIELGAMGAFLAADVFGITGHESRDSGIGQHLETITPYLDYVCPMVYPSGYAQGTDGIASPPDSPGPIVGSSVHRYRVRAPKNVVVRPWLQSFRDYNSYSKKFYGAAEIRAQIDASTKAGGSGYLLWNASGRYSEAGLHEKSEKAQPVRGQQ